MSNLGECLDRGFYRAHRSSGTRDKAAAFRLNHVLSRIQNDLLDCEE
jgi:hypothetical protein